MNEAGTKQCWSDWLNISVYMGASLSAQYFGVDGDKALFAPLLLMVEVRVVVFIEWVAERCVLWDEGGWGTQASFKRGGCGLGWSHGSQGGFLLSFMISCKPFQKEAKL